MTMPNNRGDREFTKFFEGPRDGETTVRVGADRGDPMFSVLTDRETGAVMALAPSGALEVGELIRLVGGNFESGALNPNVWESAVTGSGTATAVTGEAVLSTGTTADSTVAVDTFKRARFITATFNKSHQAMAMTNPSATDVIRRWGMYDPVTTIFSGDGIYFENNSGAITLVRIKAGTVEETVPEASFNGNPVSPTNPDKFILDGNVHIYEIVYNAGSALFFQDRRLIHRMTFTDAVGYETVHLRAGMEIQNINGNTTNNELKTRGFSCSRVGTLSARPEFLNVAAAQGAPGAVVKNSPGTLRKVIITNTGVGGATITLYDGLDNTGPVVASILLTAQLVELDFGLDFNFGLTYTASGSGFEVLVIYD